MSLIVITGNVIPNNSLVSGFISFSSDWLYPTRENKEIVIALNACGANVGFVEINSDKGHDSFLLDVPKFLKTLSEFLNSVYNEINNEKEI
jgi:homoserine O-acetyltransferase